MIIHRNFILPFFALHAALSLHAICHADSDSVLFLNTVHGVLQQISPKSAQDIQSWRDLARYSMDMNQITPSQFLSRSGLDAHELESLLQNGTHTPRVRLAVAAQFVSCSQSYLALDVLRLPELQVHLGDDPQIAQQFDWISMTDEIRKNREADRLRRKLPGPEGTPSTRNTGSTRAEKWKLQRLDLAKNLRVLLDTNGITMDFIVWLTGQPTTVLSYFIRTGQLPRMGPATSAKLIATLRSRFLDVDIDHPLEADVLGEYQLWREGKHPLQLKQAEEISNDETFKRELALQQKVLLPLKQSGFYANEILQMAGIASTSANRNKLSRITQENAEVASQIFSVEDRDKLRELLNEKINQLNYPSEVKHKAGLELAPLQIRDSVMISEAIRMLKELSLRGINMAEIVHALPHTAQTSSLFYVDWMEFDLPVCTRFLGRHDQHKAARWTQADHAALTRLYKKYFP